MKETELKLEPYDDYEVAKERADRILDTILQGVSYFEYYVRIKPTVFMSHDVLAIVARYRNEAITSYKYGEPLTVCGYELKLALGKNMLYLGYQLSMPL